MAATKRYDPNQSLDLDHILQEAQHRWLRPVEICEILHNYTIFKLTPDPPVRPPAGSLFLFDRKVLRYFRKDGHRWRKKRDGKTVKEAHEKLKAGSVDALHCYYAHGEDNENFQRRSYWMLDEQLEHIVLVHYREVKEGYKLGTSRVHTSAHQGSQLGVLQSSFLSCLESSHSPSVTGQASHASDINAANWDRQSDFDKYYRGDQATSSDIHPTPVLEITDISSLGGKDLSRLLRDRPSFTPGAGSSPWPGSPELDRNIDEVHNEKSHFEQLSQAEILSHKLFDARLDSYKADQGVAGDGLFADAYRTDQGIGASSAFAGKNAGLGMNENETLGIKKLDSFGRWMDREIGGDCNDSLLASDSCNYWNTIDSENDNKEVSSLSHHMQLDIGSLGPSISQVQLFSITEFSPDWAYSGIETKILIIGTFLGENLFNAYKWCCMFGEIEVSAEVLMDTVIRCQVPFHAPGRVPFYVTCSNRLACSEVREFEFRQNLSAQLASISAPEDEVRLQIRIAKLLNSSIETKWLDCPDVHCDNCKLKAEIELLKHDGVNSWGNFEDILVLIEGNGVSLRDALIENLLKHRLYDWLVCKVHSGLEGLLVLDDEGLGLIHLAAALGYVWALHPIVAAGVSPNFRDARGRTALHWASHYGREETVIALVRLDTAAGAVDDPTLAYPGGQTAADIASSRGHKGIAGYLAETNLISCLRSLDVSQDMMNTLAATVADDKSLLIATQVTQLDRGLDKDISLKGSLAAVRKSAQAAALIHATFRSLSFRQRQFAEGGNGVPEVPVDLVALGSLNKVQNVHDFEDYLHCAAIRIQQKYRGWKGRKEFLKMRNRILRIQAHVRGHHVRKQYKKVVWSVGIVEKAILRWRRKKPGLRGFRASNASGSSVPDLDNNDEYEFLRVGRKQKSAGVEKALARVQSMVRDPEARDQYMRLVTKFENFQLNNEGSKGT